MKELVSKRDIEDLWEKSDLKKVLDKEFKDKDTIPISKEELKSIVFRSMETVANGMMNEFIKKGVIPDWRK